MLIAVIKMIKYKSQIRYCIYKSTLMLIPNRTSSAHNHNLIALHRIIMSVKYDSLEI